MITLIESMIGWILTMAEVLVRSSTLRIILLPAACIVPRSWGLATADAVSWLLLLLPRPGIYAVREAHNLFGRGPLQSLLLARRRLARPLRDYVVFIRVLRGREDPAAWTVSEMNVAGVEKLRAHGTPYIVATGHFAREAVMAMHLPRIAPGELAHVVSAIPASPPSLSERLGWKLFRVTLDGWAKTYGRGLQFVLVGPKQPRPSQEVLKQLQKPGAIVYIHVDAPWAWRAAERTSFIRSFAGTQLQVFALGAARLARKANCPVVLCLPRIAGDRTVVLEWGEPMAVSEEADEIPVMNVLFDQLETAIAKYPDQYVLPIGRDRRWNPSLQRWEDIENRC